MGARTSRLWLVALVAVVPIGCGNSDDTGAGGSGGAGGAGGGSLACRFNATVGGQFSATFDGAAEWVFASDTLSLTLQSRDSIAGGSDPFLVNVETATLASLAPGTYTIVAGTVTSSGSEAWSAVYIRGQPGFDCPNCGGNIEIESFDGESLTGGFALEAPLVMSDESGEISIGSSFTALTGAEYIECESTYAP